MKMDSESYDRLAAFVASKDTPEVRAAYLRGDFPRSELVKDLNKRYRWDLFHATVPNEFVRGQYDAGLNDSHLYTALKSAVPALVAT